MTPTSPQAWMLSFALHTLVIGLIALFTYATRLTPEVQPKILELVAGPGEDYTAREAPALGSESAVKLEIPKAAPPPTPVAPAPTPVQPIPTPAPVIPTPPPPVKKEAPKTVPKKEPDPAKDIAKDLKSRMQQADRKAKKDAAIQRKKEEVQRKKEEARLTKEQFDKLNAAKKVASAAPTKNQPTKFKPIDAKGIASGVVGGSAASKAGAGGKALTREEATLLELYYSEFRRRLRESFEEDRPTSLSDSLVVTIDVHSNPDGSFSNPKVTKSSGSSVFDQAVLAALRRMKMPPRPDKGGETISFIFRMRDPD